mmetsp:Transcript_15152/g.57593  ORF Transcript_15152/g.57593 Transcript_15152/m.57593 type:complete len:287 (+) Transcript_15152:2978-3838(+)
MQILPALWPLLFPIRDHVTESNQQLADVDYISFPSAHAVRWEDHPHEGEARDEGQSLHDDVRILRYDDDPILPILDVVQDPIDDLQFPFARCLRIRNKEPPAFARSDVHRLAERKGQHLIIEFPHQRRSRCDVRGEDRRCLPLLLASTPCRGKPPLALCKDLGHWRGAIQREDDALPRPAKSLVRDDAERKVGDALLQVLVLPRRHIVKNGIHVDAHVLAVQSPSCRGVQTHGADRGWEHVLKPCEKPLHSAKQTKRLTCEYHQHQQRRQPHSQPRTKRLRYLSHG